MQFVSIYMALKSRALGDLDSSTCKDPDFKQMLLLSGWPQSLIDEYVMKNQKQYRKLEVRPESALVMLDSVSKRFGSRTVLDSVSLQIVPGELLGIIGLSGAGKTTFLNVLVGFLRPDAGRVTLKLPDGSITSIDNDSNLVKAMFGFAAQTPSFYSKLTVKENLEHFGALYGITDKDLVEKIGEILVFVGLENSKDTIAHNLSGGMQKRLDIACALVHEPKLLILDEPTADLDPLLRKQMWQLIKDINRKGTTVIVASHFVDEIEEYCSRIAVLANSRVQQVGTAEQLVGGYAVNYEIEIETVKKDYSSLINSLARQKFVEGYDENGDSLVVITANPGRMLSWFAKYCQEKKEKLVRLNLSKPSLSEVFESIVLK